jgi:hypothetical protein
MVIIREQRMYVGHNKTWKRLKVLAVITEHSIFFWNIGELAANI